MLVSYVAYAKGLQILFGTTLKNSYKFFRPQHFMSIYLLCCGKHFTIKYKFED